MFDAVLSGTRGSRPRRWPFVVIGTAVNVGVAAAVVSAFDAQERSRPAIQVRVVPPRLPFQARAAPARPALPPMPESPIPRRAEAAPRPPPPPVAPRQVPPSTPPPPAAEPEPMEGSAAELPSDERSAGAGGGAPDGVVGGIPAPSSAGSTPAPPPPAHPIEARPADLAIVRAGVARTLVYPPEAKRSRWQGKTLVSFLLRSDGSIADLRVQRGSGYPTLDAAALAAIRAAAPFSPPGTDVIVIIPVSFTLS